MTTIKDIAAKLGVSSGTVSKGLNGGSDISEELRQQILDTAVEMGYSTKQSRKISNRKLCLLIENMDYKTPNDFGYEVVLGFRQIAAKEKWNVEIIEVTKAMEQTDKYDTYLLKNGYSGAFLVGFALDDRWTEELKTSRMPTVILDNSIPFMDLYAMIHNIPVAHSVLHPQLVVRHSTGPVPVRALGTAL